MNICSINNILPNWIATLIQVNDFVEIELGIVEKIKPGETLRGTTVVLATSDIGGQVKQFGNFEVFPMHKIVYYYVQLTRVNIGLLGN